MLALPSRSQASCSPPPRISNGATKNDFRGSTPLGAPLARIHENAMAAAAITTTAAEASQRVGQRRADATAAGVETTVADVVRGAAAMGLDGVAPSSARANSSAVLQRSAGSLLSARSIVLRDLRRQVGTRPRERRGRLGQLLRQHLHRRRAGERRGAGEHLVAHETERIDVAPAVELPLADGLLGTHVARRADDEPRARDGESSSLSVPLANARATPKSVSIARPVARVEQHVLRLHVAVHDTLRVRVAERAREVGEQRGGAATRGPPRAPRARASAADSPPPRTPSRSRGDCRLRRRHRRRRCSGGAGAPPCAPRAGTVAGSRATTRGRAR